MAETVLDRFLRYVVIDTQSKEDSETYPSSAKQLDLLKLLAVELKSLGASDVGIDEHGYVTARIPSNVKKNVPAIGFISHVDTSPEVTGMNVKPQVIKNYKSGDIALPGDKNIIIRESENPSLKLAIGKAIVTSDGTTLLGADDKAGVAAIMTAVQELLRDREIPHGEIKIGFTPDEEVGAGTKYFDIKKFGAKFAYTVDGDTPGELNKETFSANSCVITVHGRDIHPGTAKGIMVNSVRVIAEIISRLPKNISPEMTEGYEPYIHPYILEGGVGKSSVKILFRDFKTEGLTELKKVVDKVVSEVHPMFPKAKIEVRITEQYRNMREGVEKDTRVADYLFEATERAGIKTEWKPIRGGTDGSKLTEAGLPTPNIFTGGANFHSRTEWVNVWGMEKAVETILNVARIWAEKSE
ncbi:MAG TPA: peptidase T [Candidatus Acidoferrales bacterium]|nr:peptidase T [Candidatus Acidoferrales bacterium]